MSANLCSIVLFVVFFAAVARCNKVGEAEQIGLGFIEFAKKTTNYHKMTEEFDAIYKAGQLKIKPLDGAQIVKKFKSDLESTFGEKTKALRKIKTKVEEEKRNHVPKKTIPHMR